MNTKTILLSISAIVLFAISGSAQQSGNRKAPPSVDEIFEELDADEDGLLSKEEVKGPLKDMFDEIDEDGDGFLSKEEIENMPKPKGKRPERS